MPSRKRRIAATISRPDKVGEHQPSILVVNSERIISDSLAIILRQQGYCATPAYQYEGAVEFVARETPDLVITNDPYGGAGRDFCRHIKLAFSTEIPVILYSNFETSEKLLEEAGVDVFFKMPVHPQELLTHIRRLLASSAPRRVPTPKPEPQPEPAPERVRVDVTLAALLASLRRCRYEQQDAFPRVLVVEPHDETRHAVAAMLRARQIATATAARMDDAAEIITANKPAVVITEDSLVDGSGCELCRQMKHNRWCAAVRFVLWTGHELPQNRIQASGIGLVVSKQSHRAKELVKAIADLLENEIDSGERML